MKLKLSALVALALGVILITSWELYWRSKDRVPTIQGNKHLFAAERHKVHDLQEDDFVIVGSSRVLFNIQLDEFEKLTGKKPIQLAIEGSSPLPTFRDIVKNTEFKGTIIVGVTPGLFFSTTFPKAGPIENPQSKVDHYLSRTIAQRIGHNLSIPLQKNFVFVSEFDPVLDEHVDLRALLNNIEIDNRLEKPRYPPFFGFGAFREDRNMRMIDKVANDTNQANVIKNAWKFVLGGNNPPPDKNGTTAYFAEDAAKFKERGGKIILVRCPSSGIFKQGEAQFLPRERFYDSLVNVVKAPSYHYNDYEQLRNIQCCPEWSHLSGENADIFTRELVKILQEDKLVPINQIN
ncbi:MAG: hypothetical protein ACWA5P_06270 [bacterium]